jgi:adenylate cyclase
VEGTVRKVGTRLRVTAQLIDTHTDEHIWSETYETQIEDVFSIQSDIAKNIAECLKVQLLDNEKRGIEKKATTNMEAHTLLMKGRFYWNERTEEGLVKAKEYFKRRSRGACQSNTGEGSKGDFVAISDSSIHLAFLEFWI